MAKWYGEIGFGVTKETTPGVWVEDIVTRNYYGDVIKDYRQNQGSEFLNDNINISNTFSILSDPFANQNFSSMKYLVYSGVKWKITSVDIQYPRLILSVGGVYTDD